MAGGAGGEGGEGGEGSPRRPGGGVSSSRCGIGGGDGGRGGGGCGRADGCPRGGEEGDGTIVGDVSLDAVAGGAFGCDASTPSSRPVCAPVIQTGVTASRRTLEGRCGNPAAASIGRVLVLFRARTSALLGMAGRIAMRLLIQTLIRHIGASRISCSGRPVGNFARRAGAGAPHWRATRVCTGWCPIRCSGGRRLAPMRL